MAIGTGLVQGTSRGLAREQEWKFRDRTRSMAREESQLDQLIGQINTNQQMKYRKERDTVADNQWTKTHALRVSADDRAEDANVRAEAVETRARDWNVLRKERYPIEMKQADERHSWLGKQESRAEKTSEQQTEAYNYNKGRRTFREDVEKKTLAWQEAREERAGKTFEQQEEAYNYNKGRRTQAEAVANMTVRQMELKLEELERDGSEKGIKEAADLRALIKEKMQADIGLTKQRTETLKNPPTTSRTLKLLTFDQAKTIGKNYHAVQSIVKAGKKLPYQSDTGPSQFSVMGEAGFFNGARLKGMIPVGATRSEVNQIFEGIFQGLLEQVVQHPKKDNEYTTLNAQLLRGSTIEEHRVRMNSLRNEFMRQMWDGFIKGAPTNTGEDYLNMKPRKGYSFEEEIGLDFDHKEGGRANRGFWGTLMREDTGLLNLAFGAHGSAKFGTEEFVAQQFGKDLNPDKYMKKRPPFNLFGAQPTNERFTPFQLGQWIDAAATQYTSRGSIDWDHFSVLPDNKKADFYSKLPEDKQSQFKIEWESFIQEEQKDRILYRQNPAR